MAVTLGVWAPVKRNRLLRGALMAGLVLATTTAVIVVVRALEEQRADALVIDVAGRQRMLSERLVKVALLGASGFDSGPGSGADGFAETRVMLVRSADRLIGGGELQIRDRLIALPAPRSEAVRQRLELHRRSIDRQIDAAERVMRPLLAGEDTASRDSDVRTLIEISGALHAELDETVRLLSEGSSAATASARRWALASASLIVALSLILVLQVLRADALARRLRTSEERLELAVLGSNDGLWDWDLTSDQVHYSHRFKKLLGFSDDEFPAVAESIRSRVHPGDRKRVFSAFDSHMRDQIPFDEDCRLRTKSGAYSYFRVRGRAVFDRFGKAVRMAGAITDVSTQKEAESLLERQAQRARLVHLATSMAAETDSFEEALQSSVDSVCETTGWPVGHAYVPGRGEGGRRLLMPTGIWHAGDDGLHVAMREVTERTTFERGVGLPGRIWSSESPAWITNVQEDENFPRAKLSDDLRVKGAFGFPIKVGGELVAILEFFAEEEMDPDPELLRTMVIVGEQVGRVLERKRSQDELLRAGDAAREANRAKSRFLANMSHELRTPLNSVIGFSTVLMRSLADTIPEKEKKFLERVRDNGVHLLSLINEVLDISKIEAGKMKLDVAAVELGGIISEVIEDLEMAAGEKGLSLASTVPGELTPVLADGARLKQVLINLVANAIKFTETGGVAVRVRTAAGSGRPSHIDVADTGIGISDEQLPAVFDSFHQADGSTTRRFSGSGLGLTISRSLCRLMGFDLIVQSEPESGSTFTICLDGAGATGSEEAPSTDSLRPLAVEHRVLVIDDDEDTRVLLGEYLREMGCQVVAAASGDQGLNLAREMPPDLITLDLMMPGMNGWEVLHRLKSDPVLDGIPVVVVSIVASENRSALLGAVDTLSKPIERGELKRVLARLLDSGPKSALVVQDVGSRGELVELLRDEGLEVLEAGNGAEALESLDSREPDLVILDLLMPEMDGTEFLARLREQPRFIDLPVVVVASKGLSRAEVEELERRGAEVLRKGEALEARLKKTVLRGLRRAESTRSES